MASKLDRAMYESRRCICMEIILKIKIFFLSGESYSELPELHDDQLKSSQSSEEMPAAKQTWP